MGGGLLQRCVTVPCHRSCALKLRCLKHAWLPLISVAALHACSCAELHSLAAWLPLLPPTVAHLQQVLQTLPHLEAVEVEGLSAEAIGALLPTWQAALQHRGHQGCTVAGEGSALRFARVAE